MRVSVVVAAYNEERNIKQMLTSLVKQKLTSGELAEVVVVASGCTDRTHQLVEEVAAQDRRVRLLIQDARLGKASALNAYFRERDPQADVIVLASADLLLQPGCLEVFCRAFRDDPRMGMCGARPIPTNPRDSLLGRMVGYLWDLHHDIALEAPKAGELAAVRATLIDKISEETPVDEASIEAQVVAKGYTLRYLPEAVVANRGPDNMSDFVRQRRRIAAGHYWLRSTTGYEVSTMDPTRILRYAVRRLTFSDPKTDAAYMAAAGVEALARGLGYLDYRRNHSHAVWEIASSTKEVTDPGLEDAPSPEAKTRHG